MLILDFNGIVIANILTQKLEIDENLIRHMVLNSIRKYRFKYREYGDMVIVADGSGNWRKEYFPEYKAGRQKSRDESPFDWGKIFEINSKIQDELRDNFPYKVIKVHGCEADDVIAVLTQETQQFGKCEDVMIISSDKDFVQLLKYPNVKQFSPTTKKLVKDDDPETTLFQHIIKGDGSDGVPNIYMPNDFLNLVV